MRAARSKARSTKMADFCSAPVADFYAAVDTFLDLIEETRASKGIFRPVNLHFSTHTASVHEDVCDETGELLLSHLFRLEDMQPALNQVFETCGLARRFPAELPQVNSRAADAGFAPDAKHRSRIERIYAQDFDLFETCRTL